MQNQKSKKTLPIKLVIFFVKLIERIESNLMKLPLYLYTILMSIVFLALPIILSWTVFSVAIYLPNPYRAILIWGLIVFLTILAGAIEYVKSH